MISAVKAQRMINSVKQSFLGQGFFTLLLELIDKSQVETSQNLDLEKVIHLNGKVGDENTNLCGSELIIVSDKSHNGILNKENKVKDNSLFIQKEGSLINMILDKSDTDLTTHSSEKKQGLSDNTQKQAENINSDLSDEHKLHSINYEVSNSYPQDTQIPTFLTKHCAEIQPRHEESTKEHTSSKISNNDINQPQIDQIRADNMYSDGAKTKEEGCKGKVEDRKSGVDMSAQASDLEESVAVSESKDHARIQIKKTQEPKSFPDVEITNKKGELRILREIQTRTQVKVKGSGFNQYHLIKVQAKYASNEISNNDINQPQIEKDFIHLSGYEKQDPKTESHSRTGLSRLLIKEAQVHQNRQVSKPDIIVDNTIEIETHSHKVDLVKKLADVIHYTAESHKKEELIVHLKPEFLGKLKIKLTSEDGHLRIELFTESHLVKEAITSHVSVLQKILIDRGIPVQEIGVFLNWQGSQNDRRFTEYKFRSSHWKVDDFEEDIVSPFSHKRIWELEDGEGREYWA